MTESSLSVSNETKIHISFQNDKNDNYEVARTVFIELSAILAMGKNPTITR